MEQDKDEWDEWQLEEGNLATKSLFDQKIFNSPEECWKDAAENHNFDIVKLTKEWHLTTYDHVKLVNYLRSQTPDKINTAIQQLSNVPSAPWKDEIYLKPVIQDDPLLCATDFGEDQESGDWSDNDQMLAPTEKKDAVDISKLSKEELIAKLNKMSNLLLEEQMKTAQQEKTIFDLRKITGDYLLGNTEVESPSISPRKEIHTAEEDYFSSYAHFGIHQQMIGDTIRTEAYRDFIFKNTELFKGKVVLDVGCGTGILSFFASKAGARKVFSVDNSDIIDVAQKIAKENSIENVQFIKNKLELIETLGPDFPNVDIIISEWMGYGLLFECMLPSVLVAREKWCGKTGLVYPDIASMFLCGWYNEDYYQCKIGFWSEVYGFSMNSMKDQILTEPQTEPIDKEAIKTNSHMFKSFNINTVKLDELDFTSPFSLTVQNTQLLHGFVTYFDIHFSNCKNPISFSTGPFTKDTHWHQTIFFLEKPLPVENGDIIEGSVTCKRKHLRNLIFLIQYAIKGKTQINTQSYVL